MSAKRQWIDSSTLSAGVLLVAALLAMVNYLGWKYYKRFDWTSDELYTLSEKSKAVLQDLGAPIEALIFMSPGEPLFNPVNELLSRYDAESDKFSVRVIDPEKNLAQAQSLVDRFELTGLDVVVLDRGDDKRLVEGADLADYDFSGLQMGQGPEMTGFKGEQAFTGAILELVEDSKPRAVFTTGHGELRLDDGSARGLNQLQELLRRDNFELDEWAPLGESSVPDRTDLIVIAGPTAAFVEPELDLIDTFLEDGGRLLALVDPVITSDGTVPATGLEEFLSNFGITLGSDIVIDPSSPIPFYGAETFFVNSFGSHPITRALSQAEIPVIVPLARSLTIATDPTTAGQFSTTPLLRTSSEGWGERDLEDLSGVARDDSDIQGPVTVGAAVEIGGADGDEETPVGDVGAGEGDVETGEVALSARLVVVGDSDFLSNAQLQNVGNAELAAGVINWLVERENLVGIPAKKPEQTKLTLTGGELKTIGALVFLVLPGLAIFAGVAVFLRRRR